MLDKIRVDELADSGQTYGGHAYHDCLDTARADHVPIVYPRADDVWRTDEGVILRFIGPSLPLIGGKNAIDDNSIAFVLQYRSFRMLFTGDAGAAAEQRTAIFRTDESGATTVTTNGQSTNIGETVPMRRSLRTRPLVLTACREL